MSSTKYWDTLTTAADIAQERGKSYGDVKDSFEKISAICKEVFNLDLTPKQITQVMIAIKLSRNLYKHKDDNIIDAINYLAIMKHLN